MIIAMKIPTKHFLTIVGLRKSEVVLQTLKGTVLQN